MALSSLQRQVFVLDAFIFFQFLLTILASASSFTYHGCFPLIHRVPSKLWYVSFRFTRNYMLLRVVAIIFIDRVRAL